jgi:hypothetical protein
MVPSNQILKMKSVKFFKKNVKIKMSFQFSIGSLAQKLESSIKSQLRTSTRSINRMVFWFLMSAKEEWIKQLFSKFSKNLIHAF